MLSKDVLELPVECRKQANLSTTSADRQQVFAGRKLEVLDLARKFQRGNGLPVFGSPDVNFPFSIACGDPVAMFRHRGRQNHRLVLIRHPLELVTVSPQVIPGEAELCWVFRFVPQNGQPSRDFTAIAGIGKLE